MARLRQETPTENAGSDDSDYQQTGPKQAKQTMLRGMDGPRPAEKKTRSSPRKQAPKLYEDPVEESSDAESDPGRRLMPKSSPRKAQPGRQIRLTPLSTLGKPLQSDIRPAKDVRPGRKRDNALSPNKATPRLLPKATPKLEVAEKAESSDGAEGTEVEESIWCGSAGDSEDSEEELPSPRKFLVIPPKQKSKSEQGSTQPLQVTNAPNLSTRAARLAISDSDSEPPTKLQLARVKATFNPDSRPGSSSDKENAAAFLQFSPPRVRSPSKNSLTERPVTPPQSPSKSRLQSPSKTKTRIPTPPLRPSLDAFWSADTVNDWNEQYSPKKILKSPQKLKLSQEGGLQSPISSPKKSQSPSKRTKAEIEAKKEFEARKHRVAENFLEELDRVVTKGEIQQLSASTGGVRFIWSKTLNSTAGRANWRRETTKTRKLEGASETTHKHFASIELAEKVIDDENRLLNVIAHEFCHLANFMVSGIKDQPHGRQFKEWGRKCTQAFAERGVHVTTKHSYQIEYKYVWQCSNEDCGVEFKRHSKSIDPKRHTCGTCRGKLVQVKPVPRKDAGGGTGYAGYVKANFAEVRRGMPGASQKEVMEAVGRKYRAEKEAKKMSPEDGAADVVNVPDEDTKTDVDNVARVLEFVRLDDD